MSIDPADKLAAFVAPHMLELEQYRAEVAAFHGRVPHFDPDDGGNAASVLLLLETPGPRGGAIRFVSRDNPTGTSRNIARFCKVAGLARRDTVLWNVVPWLIHAPGALNRAPTRAETAAGMALLPGLLKLLPRLHVAVLCGREAGFAEPLMAQQNPALRVLRMPHPSPTYVCTDPAIAGRIIDVLAEAAKLAADAGAPRWTSI